MTELEVILSVLLVAVTCMAIWFHYEWGKALRLCRQALDGWKQSDDIAMRAIRALRREV